MYFFDSFPTHMVRSGAYYCVTLIVWVQNIYFILIGYTLYETVT
jgi:hypothetical protein